MGTRSSHMIFCLLTPKNYQRLGSTEPLAIGVISTKRREINRAMSLHLRIYPCPLPIMSRSGRQRRCLSLGVLSKRPESTVTEWKWEGWQGLKVISWRGLVLHRPSAQLRTFRTCCLNEWLRSFLRRTTSTGLSLLVG